MYKILKHSRWDWKTVQQLPRTDQKEIAHLLSAPFSAVTHERAPVCYQQIFLLCVSSTTWHTLTSSSHLSSSVQAGAITLASFSLLLASVSTYLLGNDITRLFFTGDRRIRQILQQSGVVKSFVVVFNSDQWPGILRFLPQVEHLELRNPLYYEHLSRQMPGFLGINPSVTSLSVQIGWCPFVQDLIRSHLANIRHLSVLDPPSWYEYRIPSLEMTSAVRDELIQVLSPLSSVTWPSLFIEEHQLELLPAGLEVLRCRATKVLTYDLSSFTALKVLEHVFLKMTLTEPLPLPNMQLREVCIVPVQLPSWYWLHYSLPDTVEVLKLVAPPNGDLPDVISYPYNNYTLRMPRNLQDYTLKMTSEVLYHVLENDDEPTSDSTDDLFENIDCLIFRSLPRTLKRFSIGFYDEMLTVKMNIADPHNFDFNKAFFYLPTANLEKLTVDVDHQVDSSANIRRALALVPPSVTSLDIGLIRITSAIAATHEIPASLRQFSLSCDHVDVSVLEMLRKLTTASEVELTDVSQPYVASMLPKSVSSLVLRNTSTDLQDEFLSLLPPGITKLRLDRWFDRELTPFSWPPGLVHLHLEHAKHLRDANLVLPDTLRFLILTETRKLSGAFIRILPRRLVKLYWSIEEYDREREAWPYSIDATPLLAHAFTFLPPSLVELIADVPLLQPEELSTFPPTLTNVSLNLCDQDLFRVERARFPAFQFSRTSLRDSNSSQPAVYDE